MDIKMQTRIARMLTQVIEPMHSTEPVVEAGPVKTAMPAGTDIEQPFKRATPESVGIKSQYIKDFLTEIDNDKTLDPHAIMIIRSGKVISEASFGPYSTRDWHIEYSLTKTITGLAVGILWDEGKIGLDESVFEIFGKKRPTAIIGRDRPLTVRDLLGMRSGASFNEVGVCCSDNWVEDFFASGFKFKPGAKFDYNSMNTYMLAAAVCRITGMTLRQYLDPRLFGPLGIKDYLWEVSPEGIEQGGMGLYLRIEDMAKIAQMIMDKGVWNGKQVVSSKWIDTMTAKHSFSGTNSDLFDYGYQVWVGRYSDSFLMNGLFGQNAIGLRDKNMIICSNFGNNEAFQTSSYFSILSKYFLNDDFKPSDQSLPGNALAVHGLRAQEKKLRVSERAVENTIFQRMSEDQMRDRICGTYALDPLKCRSLSVMPFLVQVMQNNFTRGTDRITIEEAPEGPVLTFYENGHSLRIPTGIKAVQYSTVNYYGEPYKMSGLCRFAFNEDNVPIMIVEIRPVETVNSRRIKITLTDTGISMQFSENPGYYFIKDYVNSMEEGFLTKTLGFINTKLDPDYFDYRLTKVISPTITAERISSKADSGS
ncbi:MAG: serine hydrolase domain-containing protein [Oscillospiraceae bacterium]|jgi:CubicO group peptidase (beta-lactamase class C family)